jgi:hypothetical protein
LYLSDAVLDDKTRIPIEIQYFEAVNRDFSKKYKNLDHEASTKMPVI